jgi:hypothetical protein
VADVIDRNVVMLAPEERDGGVALLPELPVVALLSRLQPFADLSPIGEEGRAAPKATTPDNVPI